jgi:hypothetical protein
MAITVTSDLTFVNTTGGDVEVLTNWAKIGTWASGDAISGDVYLQGSNAANARVTVSVDGTPVGGWYHLATQAANADYTDGRHIFIWLKCFCLPAADTRAHGGLRVTLSADATPTLTGTVPWNGPTNSKQWFVGGQDLNPTSGWICYVVDPTSTPDLTLGTATVSSTDRIGFAAVLIHVVGGGSVKPQPIIWDATRYGTYIMLKTTAAETAKFSDYYVTDSTTSNQWGIISLVGGIYNVQGKIKIGDTAQTAVTTFTDTNQTLVWQDNSVAAGFYEIIVQGAGSFATTATLGSISGTLTSGGCTIRGVGLTTRRLLAPVIVAGGTGYAAGNILTVSGGTGTAATMKVITVSGGVITELRMETTGSYSVPPTGTLTLTGGGGSSATCTATVAGGSIWTLTASAANQTLNLYASTLSQMKSAALASTSTLDGCIIVDSGEITVNGATIKNCTFQDMRTTTPISAAYQLRVTTTTPVLTNNKYVNCATALLWDRNADTNTKLDGSTFISGGTGYAIELGTNTPSSITLTNVTFTGYGADTTTNACIYNNSGKAITINITGGSTPTYNNGTSASTVIVANTVSTSVTVKNSATPPVALQYANVLVYADTGGPYPSNATVTIANSGTTATVTHNSHAMATGDKVLIKGASLQANNGVYTITYINANSYSYTMTSTPGSNPTGTIKAWFVALFGLTDSSGLISMSRVIASAQPIIGRVRKSTQSIDSGAQTIAVNSGAKTFTRSTGSFLTDHFEPGMTITMTGFTDSGNNTTKVIDTVAATIITVTSGTGLVTESGTGDEHIVASNLTVYKTSNFIGSISATAGYSNTVQLIEDQ